MFSFVHQFVLSFYMNGNCFAREEEVKKDKKSVFHPGDSLLKTNQNIRFGNFFAAECDIFEVDKGWYNVSIMEYYGICIL